MKKLLLSLVFFAAGLALHAAVSFTLDCAATPSDTVFTDAPSAIAAINAAARSGVRSVTLNVHPGVYWLDDPDDPADRLPDPGETIPFAARIAVDTLRIIAVDPGPVNTVWAVNRGQTQGALGNYTMLLFTGASLEIANMTLGNFCNVDLVYPRDPSLNRPRRRDAIVQAQVGICAGTDRLYARNCRFISRLNMCPLVGARRALYKDCYMECTDDALAGSAVYQHCSFTFFSGKPFYNTASHGAVMLDCDIHSLTRGTQYFTKAPGQMALVDVRITSDSPLSLDWSLYPGDVTGYYSNVTLNGRAVAPADGRAAVDMTGCRILDAYRLDTPSGVIYNTPCLLEGDDTWDPLGLRPAVIAEQRRRGVPLLGLPVTTGTMVSITRPVAATGDSCILSPALARWGGYPLADADVMREAWSVGCQWQAPDVLRLVNSPGRSGDVVAISANSFPDRVDATVTAVSRYGLRAVATIPVAPFLKPAPAFAVAPSVSIDRSARQAVVDFQLTPVQDNDCSHITWYRVSPDGSSRIPLWHGSGPRFRRYSLTTADVGSSLVAVVTPRGVDTEAAPPLSASLGRNVGRLDAPISLGGSYSMVADLAAIPLDHQPAIAPGAWTVDAFKPADTARYDWTTDPANAWYYGIATDGARSSGLVQASRGARLFYTPPRAKCRDMSLTVALEPCKPAGQGFGSATGQYLDIYLKFDPVTLSGYGLRIERVPSFDKAVTFTLMRFDSGLAVPLSEPVASSCYRTTCTVTLAISRGLLTASARTDAPDADPRPGVLPAVDISARVDTPDPHAVAFGFQHTGSVGASATLISAIEASWK